MLRSLSELMNRWVFITWEIKGNIKLEVVMFPISCFMVRREGGNKRNFQSVELSLVDIVAQIKIWLLFDVLTCLTVERPSPLLSIEQSLSWYKAKQQ